MANYYAIHICPKLFNKTIICKNGYYDMYLAHLIRLDNEIVFKS